jgi:hypothetical protein
MTSSGCKLAIVAAMCLLNVDCAFAQSTFSGNNLLRYCEQGQIILGTPDGVRSGANIREASMCLGFLEGARMGIALGEETGGSGGPRLFCSPDDATTVQYFRIAIQWMRQHPERLHEHGVVLVAHALHDAFPCK